ncbi:MAG: hypothetical protein IPK60_12170 [Sandaracinaceae bacterium]|nr:hypothetical protein [Sandaracinaceae bacterium]
MSLLSLRAQLPLVLAFALLSSGCFSQHEIGEPSDGHEPTPSEMDPVESATVNLEVRLSTALRPQIDFDQAQVLVTRVSSAAIVGRLLTHIAVSNPEAGVAHLPLGWVEALRAPDDYRVTVRLLRADETILTEHSVVISLLAEDVLVDIAFARTSY